MTEAKWAHFARNCFTGFDTDHTMLCISVTNLILYSISHPDIFYQDSGAKKKQISERYTLCLTNLLPFKGPVDAESINDESTL